MNYAPAPISKEELEKSSLAHLPPITPSMIDTSGALNKKPVLPGKDGVPFRGEVPNLKENDTAEAQTQQAIQGHAAIFDLSDPLQLRYYQTLFHLVYNQKAIIGMERTDFNAQTGKYTAFVRWGFPYLYVKPGIHGQR